MSGDHALCAHALADLYHRDPLAAAAGLGGSAGERGGIAQRLEKHQDHPHAIVVHEVLEVVGGGDVGLVAGGDHVAEVELARILRDRDAGRAALADEDHPARCDDVGEGGRPAHHPIVVVHEAQVVRPANRHRVAAGDRYQLALARLTLGAGVGVAGAGDRGRPDALLACALQHRRTEMRGQSEIEQVRRPGQ